MPSKPHNAVPAPTLSVLRSPSTRDESGARGSDESGQGGAVPADGLVET